MSAEFIADKGVLKGLILTLDEGEKWSIGRDPEQVDLVIEDPKVDRLHLICRKTPDGYTVENLSESSPVLINDQPFDGERLLETENRVTIGDSVFIFYAESASGDYVFEIETPIEDDLIEEEEVFEEIKEEPEEELEEEIFEEIEEPEVAIDLTPSSRFIIKVIAGPNTGAEFGLDLDREYLIGTDPSTCDVIFNDLSVSREHTRLIVGHEGEVLIEDLGSRNGVVIDQQRIVEKQKVEPNAVISLGTSAFLLLDREAPSETIVAPIFESPDKEEEEKEGEGLDEVESIQKKSHVVSKGTLVLALIVMSLAVLLGISMVSLLQTEDVVIEKKDYLSDIQEAVKGFPAIRFTYNPSSRMLFLLGHVRTGVELNELLYKIKGLQFIQGIENNVVNDEAVWQEMNILLSRIPDFKGVSLHAPEAGVFVISGYLKTDKQASDLIDYLNVNFNYLGLLQNRVVVDQQIMDEVGAHLIQHGFGAVTVSFSAGELLLTGYVNSTQSYEYESLVENFSKIPGIRSVKNFVVAVSPEQGVIDLNKRYPGKYRVTGFSKHGDVNINVVINGRIFTRGDKLDDMIVTSIQPNTIFLEKDGLKYKIEYNK